MLTATVSQVDEGHPLEGLEGLPMDAQLPCDPKIVQAEGLPEVVLSPRVYPALLC